MSKSGEIQAITERINGAEVKNISPESFQEREPQIYSPSVGSARNISGRRPIPTLLHSNTCHYFARILTDGEALDMGGIKNSLHVIRDSEMRKVRKHDVVIKSPSTLETSNDSHENRLPRKLSKDHFYQRLADGSEKESAHDKQTAFSTKKITSSSLSSDKPAGKTPYKRILEGLSSNWTEGQKPNYMFFDSNNTIGRYALLETLGTGTFSKVQLAIHLMTKENVAIKIIDKTKIDAATRRLISREVMVLDKLHHPNIIRLYEVIESVSRLNMVMEYAAGGDLETRLQKRGPFSEVEGKLIFAQIMAAVKHLHDSKIAHRDIKAENIFFAVRSPVTDLGEDLATSGSLQKREYAETELRMKILNDHRDVLQRLQNCSSLDSSAAKKEHPSLESPDFYRVKIGDFGFSKVMDNQNQLLSTFCGSPPYAAPELFSSTSYLGPPVDMWALGVLLFYLLVGFLPFRGRTVGQLRKAILECQQVKIPQRISESASSLIRQLLCRNPRSRPKAAEIITDATNAASKRQATSVTEMQPGVRSSTRKTDHWLSGQVFPKAYPPFRISSIPDVHEQVISCPMHDGTADCATHCLPSALQDTGGQSVKIELTRNPGNLLTVPSHFDITDSRPEDNRSQRSSIIPDASVRQSETEAARLLLHMGVPLEQFDVARCLEARSSITGAYRILLHKLHRLRRLSNLIVPAQEKSTPAELENLSVCSISEGLTTFKGSLIETLGWQNLSEEQEHNQMELGRRRVCSLL